MVRDLTGEDIGKIGVYTEASAAIGIAQRRGSGKVRHIDVGMLWIQQNQRAGEVDIQKVETKRNPADVFTKHVPAEVVWRHLGSMGFEDRQGKAELAVEVAKGDSIRKGAQGSETDNMKPGRITADT